jgi:hypothetical protein
LWHIAGYSFKNGRRGSEIKRVEQKAPGNHPGSPSSATKDKGGKIISRMIDAAINECYDFLKPSFGK